jgi:hypothetical protein
VSKFESIIRAKCVFLANCAELLDLYTWRHDGVLMNLYEFSVDALPPDYELLVDIPNLPHSYHILPADWTDSRQRPDLVLYSRIYRVIILIELTVPADVGMVAAKIRKEVRYQELKTELIKKEWKAEVITVEVGAMGSLPLDLLKPFLQKFPINLHKSKLLDTISLTALLRSRVIFQRRDA